jgi:hypothetical protein
MKDNQMLADKLSLKKKGRFKESSFVNRIAKFCSFELILSVGTAGELSLVIKDEGRPDDALLLHLPVKSLIPYTWVASNLLFALCTSGSKAGVIYAKQVSFCHKRACCSPRVPGKETGLLLTNGPAGFNATQLVSGIHSLGKQEYPTD